MRLAPALAITLVLSSASVSANPDVTAVLTLTLDSAVALGVRNATQVLEQQNQVTLSAAEVLERYGQFLPDFNVGAGYGYETGTTLYTIDGKTLVDSRGQDAGFTISSTLNLFAGLGDYSALKSALARRQAREQTLEWARQQVALDLTQTYLQLVYDRQLLAIAEKNVLASQARLKLLQGQADVGSASIPDLLRQRAETSADTFNSTSLEAKVDDDEILLVRKLRVDPSASYEFTDPNLKPSPFPLGERPLAELIASAQEVRQDAAAARSTLESADWDVKSARSGYLPRLDLVFTRDAAGTLLSRDFVNGVDALNFPQDSLPAQLGNQVEYSIGLSLSWAVFDRFVTRYNTAQAETTRSNSEIGSADARLQVTADVRTAYSNYRSALKQLESVATGVEASEKSFQAVEGNYRVGSASIVDVLTAQASLVQARSNEAQALTNLRLQRSALQYAVGALSVPGGSI